MTEEVKQPYSKNYENKNLNKSSDVNKTNFNNDSPMNSMKVDKAKEPFKDNVIRIKDIEDIGAPSQDYL